MNNESGSAVPNFKHNYNIISCSNNDNIGQYKGNAKKCSKTTTMIH